MKPNTVGRVYGGMTRHPYAQLAEHGFPAGFPIETYHGALPVEVLRAGDHLQTRNAGPVPVKSIETAECTVATVVFASGCLGPQAPEKVLTLPAQQPVLVRDGRATQMLVPAGHLINDETIRDGGMQTLTLYRLCFDRPRILYGAGLELGADGQANQTTVAA